MIFVVLMRSHFFSVEVCLSVYEFMHNNVVKSCFFTLTIKSSTIYYNTNPKIPLTAATIIITTTTAITPLIKNIMEQSFLFIPSSIFFNVHSTTATTILPTCLIHTYFTHTYVSESSKKKYWNCLICAILYVYAFSAWVLYTTLVKIGVYIIVTSTCVKNIPILFERNATRYIYSGA